MSRSGKMILLFALLAALVLSLCSFAAAEEGVITEEHKMGAWVEHAPTCIASGYRERKCTNSGCTYSERETTSGPVSTAHGALRTETKAATCTEDGYTQQVCTLCNNVVTSTVLTKLGHNWGAATVETAATCHSTGTSVQVCQNNSEHKLRTTIPMLTHVWDAGTDSPAATCTNPGTKIYKCTLCGDTKTESIPAKGHSWDAGTDNPAATCTTPGTKTYTCTVCNLTRTETVPALGHDYGAWTSVKAPTCTEPGSEQRVCSRDASHIETRTVAALNHKWDAGTVTKEPTCTEPGTKLFTCQNDSSHTRTETVPATNHPKTHWVVTKEPTFKEEGERKLYCDICGALLRTEKMGVKMYYNNTICAIGPRLRDVNLSPYNSDNWYMFTPFDASRNSRQTYQLIASNKYDVGTATLEIRDGTITLNYDVYRNVEVTLEFFTILPQMSDLHEYEPEALSAYAMVPGHAYSIEDDFGGDTNLVLYFCSRGNYAINRYVTAANLGLPYRELCRTMLTMMDK